MIHPSWESILHACISSGASWFCSCGLILHDQGSLRSHWQMGHMNYLEDNKMNKLRGSRCYLAGPIDYCDNDGVAWRRSAAKFLRSLGIVVLDPTEKPMSQLDGVPSEIGEEKRKTQELKAKGLYDDFGKVAKKIRSLDLRMTDIADFLIVYLNLSIPMCGTWEELFNANRQKKPIIVMIAGGPGGAPLWLHGTISHKYMFNDLEEVKKFVNSINDGTIEMDGRWQLLDHVKLGI